MAESASTALVPRVEKVVDFYGDGITVALVDDEVYVPLRPLTEFLGLRWGSQWSRVQRDEVLARYGVLTPGGWWTWSTFTAAPSATKRNDTMNTSLWILQVLVAGFFLFHSWLYVVVPPFAADMINAIGIAPGFHQFIGGAEVLAAIGLVLPRLTGMLPWLAPLAAAGLMIVMASAVVFHISQRETPILPAALLILVLFIAYMRWQLVPLSQSTAHPGVETIAEAIIIMIIASGTPTPVGKVHNHPTGVGSGYQMNALVSACLRGAGAPCACVCGIRVRSRGGGAFAARRWQRYAATGWTPKRRATAGVINPNSA